MNSEKSKKSVLKSALAMASGTLASRVLGFVRDALILALFSRTSTDAYVVAFKLPNTFRRVLGEGALAASFMPQYVVGVESEDEAKRANAQRLASSVYGFLCGITLSLTALAIFFMEPFLGWWVGDQSGFAGVAGKMDQTVFLARVMFAYLFLVTSYAFFMTIANAHRHFLIPALAPAAFNLFFILTLFLPSSWSLVPGDSMAYGVVIGGIVQLLMVGILLLRLKRFPKPSWDLRAPGLKKVASNMLPGLVSVGTFQLLTLVNVKFVARLAEGNQSYIYAADRLLELPQSLIAISLGTALLPSFSSLWGKENRLEFLATAHRYLRVLFFLSLPCAVALFFLGQEMTDLLFVRGKFSLADSAATAGILQVYAFLLMFSGVSKILTPSFHAIQKYWMPAVVAIICVAVHVFVGNYWVDWYGVKGVAASTVLSSFLNATLLILAFQKMIGSLCWGKIFMFFLKQLLPIVALGLVFYYGFDFIDGLFGTAHLGLTIQLALSLGLTLTLGGSVYLALAMALKMDEAQVFLRLIRRRKPKLRS